VSYRLEDERGVKAVADCLAAGACESARSLLAGWVTTPLEGIDIASIRLVTDDGKRFIEYSYAGTGA